jgi:hypothetical protein
MVLLSSIGTGQNFYMKDNRKYEKPWLKNTVHEMATTQTVDWAD